MFLLIQTVLQWRIWFRSSNAPRHPESLTSQTGLQIGRKMFSVPIPTS